MAPPKNIEKSATMPADSLAWVINANGGPKCQRRAKIPPSLKRLVVSRKILHQTCTVYRHRHRHRHRPHPNPRHHHHQKNRQRRVKFLDPTLRTARRRQNTQGIVAKYKVQYLNCYIPSSRCPLLPLVLLLATTW